MNGPELLLLDPATIRVPEDRLREVNPGKVADMAASMLELGQITPIEVRAEGDGWALVTGAHRLSAVRAAQLSRVMAVEFTGSPDEARLREIDENLYREELSALDQAAFLAERLDVFRRLHGGKLAKGRPAKSGASSHRFLFYREVTDRFGLTEEVVKKALARFEGLSAEERRVLRGRAWALSGADIDRLRRLAPVARAEALKRMLRPVEPAASVAEALREMAPPSAAQSSQHRDNRLLAAWLNLAPDEQDLFLRTVIARAPRSVRAMIRKLVSTPADVAEQG